MSRGFATIDDYIHAFPSDVQDILEQIRLIAHTAAPDVGETISYAMPTFTLNDKRLLHFAAWKRHISVYGIPAVEEAVEQELAPYRTAKGMVKFPLGKPIPYDLIARAVAVSVKHRMESET